MRFSVMTQFGGRWRLNANRLTKGYKKNVAFNYFLHHVKHRKTSFQIAYPLSVF